MGYSFVGTCIILFFINLIPGLKLRAREDDEIMGIDDAEIGEFAVCPSSKSLFEILVDRIPQYDYVEITRDVVNGMDGEVGDQSSLTAHAAKNEFELKPC